MDISQLMSDISSAKDQYVKETLATTDPDKKGVRERVLTKVNSSLDALEKAMKESPKNTDEHKAVALEGARDILYDWLDSVFLESVTQKKNEPIENEVFAKFAANWEKDFFEDMEALNVLPPDVLTRVSEYVPEIVQYIIKIIENGYAYESNGSVYFDVQKYRSSPNHTYAKLVPEAVGDSKALAEGEGSKIF